jgi:hypothetical protein
MMRRWLPAGVPVMLMILALIMIRTGQRVPLNSLDFIGSLVICLAIAALVMTLRYRRERYSSQSSGVNHHSPTTQSSGR